MKLKTTSEFIQEARAVHGTKYDYSKVIYMGAHDEVIIICPEHGEFLQRAGSVHLRGFGCPTCTGNKKLTTVDFIKQAVNVHKTKYDYSLVNYISMQKKVIIICPEHGKFLQKANNHITGKDGCPDCNPMKLMDIEEFIKKANNIHKNIYDYSKVNYKGMKSKVDIICKKHGKFSQTPVSHLQGAGCPVCSNSKGELRIRNFLETNNIKFIEQYKFDDCINPITNNKLIFDFYLPELNTLIEYDGMQHFKPIKHFGGDKTLNKQIINDLIKDQYCDYNTIKLIRWDYLDNIKKINLKELE